MHTATRTAQADQVRHLSENLVSQLTKGREWATPGVEAALQRVVAGLDAGVESASPRIQAGLRRLAEELAGGVETLAPRVHEGLKPVGPKAEPVVTSRMPSGKAWWIAGAVAVAVTAGIAAWLSFRPADGEPVTPVKVQRASGVNPDNPTLLPVKSRT